MKKSEVAELVMMLMAAYPNRAIGPKTSDLYEEMLIGLDVTVARAAVHHLIQTSTFMPSIAEIRAAATSLRLGPVRSGIEAWADVTEQIRRVGPYQSPVFEDALLADIVRRWGWLQLCNNDSDATRARFIEMYDAMASRERVNQTSTVQLPAPASTPGLKRIK